MDRDVYATALIMYKNIYRPATYYLTKANEYELYIFEYCEFIRCKRNAVYNNIGALYYLKKYYYDDDRIEYGDNMIKFAIHSARHRNLTNQKN
uniref:Uncharacterized protein n=1 Tax=Mimivirus LCMiAC01 TaxID=2506608 RepID=A0A481Z0C6_9VIRU|nr:MAG: hypothetical protein LCMiAC01_03880 [Mimivirus LCMiAC01]